MQVVATILKQITESVCRFSIIYAMPILKNQRESSLFGMQRIDQGVKHILMRIFQMPFEFLLQYVGEVWHRAPNRLNQMREKPVRVVVIAVDGQPCALQTLSGEGFAPLRGQRALAVTGGRVDEHQLRSARGGEAAQDALPRHSRTIERRRSKSCRGARRGLRTRDRTRRIRPQSGSRRTRNRRGSARVGGRLIFVGERGR